MTFIPNIETFQESKELFQAELTITPTSYYTAPANKRAEVKSIMIANSGNQDRWFSLWVDQDGTTYDDTTILFPEVEVARNSTMIIETPIYLTEGANLAIRKEILGAQITVSVYGIETDLS